MDELDRQLLVNNPAWQQVLLAYIELNSEPLERPAEQAGPRWSDRIVSMNDLEPDELSAIHGQLIALGWLKFQFEAGQSGLMYRVSSEGRQLLARIAGQPVPVMMDDQDSAEEERAA